jgi:hypothetical protein
MKVNFVGIRQLTEQILPLMAEGSAIANVASNGGAGWSRRISTLSALVSNLVPVRVRVKDPKEVSSDPRNYHLLCDPICNCGHS